MKIFYKEAYKGLGLALTFLFCTNVQAQNCDRSCLEDYLDTYLTAVSSNAPKEANLWIGFRQTENSIAIPEGAGVWENVTGLGTVQRRYFDPEHGAAGYYGTVYMGDEEAVVAIRLKIDRDSVTEAEWIISRESDPGIYGEAGNTPFDLQILRDTLPEQRVVPEDQRISTAALAALVNTYFDGITSHDGRLVKGHPGCTRYENGFPTFGTPMREGMDIGNDGKMDCRTQADFGVAIVGIRDFFVVDEVAQTVMVSAVFRRDAGNTKRRNHFTELFHLDHGKIRDIHAAFYYAPNARPVPNWAPYDGLYLLGAPFE